MKAIVMKVLVCVILFAAIAGGAFYYHNYEINKIQAELISKQEQEQLLSQRIAEIQSELKSANQEKESLVKQIEEMFTEEVCIFNAGLISEQIKDIGELATVEYRYTNVGTLDASKTLWNTDFVLPGTSKTAIITMDGILKAGINVEEITITCDEVTKTITVDIPTAKILSNELDEDSLQVYDEKDGAFNKIDLEDSRSLRTEIKEKAEKNAVNSGILKDAENKAEDIIRCIIEASPGVEENYTIVFK